VTGMLRVLHLDHTSEPGGAEFALLRLVQGPCSWSPSVFVSGDDPGIYAPLGDVVTLSGVPQRPGATSAGSLRERIRFGVGILTEAGRVRRSPGFKSADVVHANTTRMIVVARLALLFSRKRFVASLRDIVTPEALGSLTVTLVRRVGLGRADGVIANSRATLESVQPWLRSSTEISVIASPIGVSKRTRNELREWEIDPVVICMVARLDPWKGQIELIDACARHLSGIPWELRLAGGTAFGHEEFAEKLRSRADELGVTDRIHFLGHVSDVAAVIDSAAVTVQFSTRPEPLGQNVLQYLARGSVVIAVNAGGPAEWIDHGVNGLLVPLGDVGALGAALRRVSTDDGLRRSLATSAVSTAGLVGDDEIVAAHESAFRSSLGDHQ